MNTSLTETRTETQTPTGTVYVLRWPSGEAGYVGSTTRPLNKRLIAHLSAARTGIKTVLYDYMRKKMAGGEEPEIFEVAVVPVSDLKTTEDNIITAILGIPEDGPSIAPLLLNRYGATDRKLINGATAKKRPDLRGVGVHPVPIRCITTGEIFPSQGAAAEALGLVQENISQAIKRNGTTGGRKFERLPANDNPSPPQRTTP